MSDPVDPEVLDRAVEEGRESVRTGMHVNTTQGYQEQEFRAIAAAAYRQGREDGLQAGLAEARTKIEPLIAKYQKIHDERGPEAAVMGENVVLVALDREMVDRLHHADTADDALMDIEHEVVAALEVDPEVLVEQVARAIAKNDGWWPNGLRQMFDTREAYERDREEYFSQARAAIACLSRSDGKGDSR